MNATLQPHLNERLQAHKDARQQYKPDDRVEHNSSLPFSCMTGAAKRIEEKLIGFPLSLRYRWFLGLLLLKTFGDAGYHRRRGEQEDRCRFSLRAWSVFFHQRIPTIQPKQVLYLRDQLVAHRIIWYEHGEADSDTGVIGWNLQLDEWYPIEHGGARAGAGNPHLGTPAFTDYLRYLKAKRTEDDPPADLNQDKGGPLPLEDVDTAFQVGTVAHSSGECSSASDPFKLGVSDCCEPAPPTVPPSPQIKVTKKPGINADASASDGVAVAGKPTRRGKSVKGTTKTAPRQKEPLDPAWDAVRQEGFRLLSATYGAHGYHHEVEAGALVHLFRQYHVRSSNELRAIWEATLLDPYWQQERHLSMTLIAQKISIYRQNPADYRRTMLQKREQHDRRPSYGPRPQSPSSPGARGGRAPGRVNRSAADRHAAMESALRGRQP